MIYRCTHPNGDSKYWYYAKGIRVCEEWSKSYDAFEKWAFQNGYKDDLTLDRIDSDKNYEPCNCRWITKQDNARKACVQRKRNRINGILTPRQIKKLQS